MKRYLWSVLFLCCSVAYAAITTQVDPPSVQIGETFRITFTQDGSVSRGMPDFTPLQQDFTLLGTERSMAYTVVNGQAQSVSRWSLLLTAKKTGVVAIPAIQIGQERSTATSVQVTGNNTLQPSDNSATSTEGEILLKTEVSQNNPYVNQQVVYTVKLYNSQRLLDAEYQPPHIEDALLIPLGDGRRYHTTENGRSYGVEEQQYAVIPQKSGSIELRAPSFSALVYDAVPRRANIHAKNIKLTVKPMPTSFTGEHWLPATQVILHEQYNDHNDTQSIFNAGSTIERIVTLQATGVPAQLLPNLNFSNGQNYNVYSGKPEDSNTVKQHELVGTTTIKVTYLLNQPGNIIIPELKLPWFNTITGKEEEAVLPARTISVIAKHGTPTQKTSSPEIKLEKPQESINQGKQVVINAKETSYTLPWLLAIGFAIAWVLTLLLWWLYPRFFGRHKKRTIFSQLSKACKENDPIQAQAAILRWASIYWPNERLLNLSEVMRLIHDSQLKKQLHLLSEALYSREKKVGWRGDELWRSVVNYRHKKIIKKNKTSDLPPINPS